MTSKSMLTFARAFIRALGNILLTDLTCGSIHKLAKTEQYQPCDLYEKIISRTKRSLGEAKPKESATN